MLKNRLRHGFLPAIAVVGLLAGCGIPGKLSNKVDDAVDEVADAADTDETSDDDGDAPDALGTNATVNETVGFSGLEYEVREASAQDPDNPSGMQVLQVNIDALVNNVRSDSAPGVQDAGLVWHNQETNEEDFATVGVNNLQDGVAGNSTADVTFEFTLDEREAETFNFDTATLRFGSEGQHAAEVPLGSEGEAVSKARYWVDDLVGEIFEYRGGDVTWEIESAFVKHRQGNGRLSDDELLLEIDYVMRNHADDSVCHLRGEGKNFQVAHLDTNRSSGDLGTSRCVSSGNEETYATGFIIPSDWVGDDAEMSGVQEILKHGTATYEEFNDSVQFSFPAEQTPWSAWPGE